MTKGGVYDAIVVGTDGSETSCRAVQRAGLYAQATDTPVVIASVFQRPQEGEVAPASQRAESPQVSIVASSYRAAVDVAGDAAGYARAAAPKANVDTVAVEGDPADALIDLAESRGNTLLVVGNRGMAGSQRFLLGSVPNKISHHASGDVLIAMTSSDTPVELPKKILIGTDGSETASRAVERGLRLAEAVGASVTLLAAGLGAKAESVLAEAGEWADQHNVSWEGSAPEGHPADELVSAGEGHDLVVVGNKGMTGASRFLLGSVPNKISHHATADLLIVRTT